MSACGPRASKRVASLLRWRLSAASWRDLSGGLWGRGRWVNSQDAATRALVQKTQRALSPSLSPRSSLITGDATEASRMGGGAVEARSDAGYQPVMVQNDMGEHGCLLVAEPPRASQRWRHVDRTPRA
eukprot:CAMPEP_0174746242 /NCGR_PEP_ID=MMETSP1094-20130205/88627_1 /TAXON_ID=156173 /ORGANISM="Chrysochromulina brevifilum, Strain UTEX LB 985" /LENGTH=127 /DNA_ID=CAMNT_0015950915 /DNA_START=396 /DNA_END=781 /DNA_ORIENTATION=+